MCARRKCRIQMLFHKYETIRERVGQFDETKPKHKIGSVYQNNRIAMYIN